MGSADDYANTGAGYYYDYDGAETKDGAYYDGAEPEEREVRSDGDKLQGADYNDGADYDGEGALFEKEQNLLRQVEVSIDGGIKMMR